MSKPNLSILLLLVVIVCVSPTNSQTLSAEQKQRINEIVNRQVEISLKTDEGIKKQGEILNKIMTFNLEVLNKRLRGAGLPDSTFQQFMCAEMFNSYPYQVVIKSDPKCRALPSYIRKAYNNLALTTAEQNEQKQLQLAFDTAKRETQEWLAKSKDFADSVQEGDEYRPIPGPLLRELYSLLFTNIDSNKYKIDFDRMEYVPKSKSEYLEKPFNLFWKAIGDHIHKKTEIEKRQKAKATSPSAH